MKDRTKDKIKDLFERHGDLLLIKDQILKACAMLLQSYRAGGKLLVCGNGGSCADSEHIVGELMKGFLLARPLDEELKNRFEEQFGEEGSGIARKLQGSLPAISLNAHAALNTAFGNDVDPALAYAQQVIGYARKNDVLLGISTSGNAGNVCYAFMAARVKGVKCIALSGGDGGRLAPLADCSVLAPARDTYLVQEYHLAIYHFICAFVESEYFE